MIKSQRRYFDCGNRLKIFRRYIGLTQIDFADLIEKSTASLVNYENDITPIPQSVLDIISGIGGNFTFITANSTNPLARGKIESVKNEAMMIIKEIRKQRVNKTLKRGK